MGHSLPLTLLTASFPESLPGGIPDIAQFTGNRYTHNFHGCIVVVEGETVGQINLSPAAINGVNVNVCPA